MRKLLGILTACSALLWAGSDAAARTWYITSDGAGDAPTIQAGIDSAHTGDVIELAPGTYRGEGNRDIEYHHAPVTVRSATGNPADCIIDCEGSPSDLHRGFNFNLGETATSILEAVTITHGMHYQGGGIHCENSSPRIQDCVLIDNTAIGSMYSDGGGMYCFRASPVVVNCLFENNRAAGPSGAGGGAACEGYVEATFEDCIFKSNVAEGGYGGGVVGVFMDTYVMIRGCLFYDNHADIQGGALWCGSNISVRFDLDGCTLAHNSAPTGSGIFYRPGSSGGESPVIARSIIALGQVGGAIYCDGYATVLDIGCTDLRGNEGGDWTGCIADQYGVNGNFSADPLFCDPDLGDFTLRSDSPCLPGNHPDGADCGLIGAFVEGCEGSISTEYMSWGGLKAMFH
ncbi:MAG: hypothetical protein ABIK65_16540 [Candidatus Eisenbacteria bacterium]